ncbi:hypothetical protein BJX64DRAFT_92278 [Aspergillus heterothallicus]
MPPIRRSARLASANAAERSPEGTAKTAPQLLNSRSSQTVHVTTKPPLVSLPREILAYIAMYLPAESQVCLTLTCHEALERLGRASWARFTAGNTRRSHGTINPLFSLLRRDLPGYFDCSTCGIMHPPLKPPRAHRKTKYTDRCFYRDTGVDFWPRTEDSGYSLVLPHITSTRQPVAVPQNVNPIALFAGDFTSRHGDVEYRLVSSGRWVGMRRNIVITQEHRLKSVTPGAVLCATDITRMPFRVCAHLSTTTEPPPPVDQGRSAYRRNGSMLFDAITRAFPDTLRSEDGPEARTFRRFTGREIDQYREAAAGEEQGDDTYIWRCTACPTKFRIEHNANCIDGSELVVTAWHHFGADPREQYEFWTMFGLRTGPGLPPKVRNCEFFVTERRIPDFETENSGPIPCGLCHRIHENSTG